jgi:hypothetical protein
MVLPAPEQKEDDVILPDATTGTVCQPCFPLCRFNSSNDRCFLCMQGNIFLDGVAALHTLAGKATGQVAEVVFMPKDVSPK